MTKSVLVFVLSMMFSFSASAQEGSHSFQESYDIKQPANLVVKSTSGSVEVVSHKGKDIKVLYTVKKGRKVLKLDKAEVEKMMDGKVRFLANNAADGLKLEIISAANKDHKSADAISINVKIFAPKHTRADLTTTKGNILVEGLELSQKCLTDTGNIILTSLPGNIVAKSNNGVLILKDVTGSVDRNIGDGVIITMGKTGN